MLARQVVFHNFLFAMLKLCELARCIEPVLQSIDRDVYLPRQRRREGKLPLASLAAAVIWFGCTGMRCFKRYVQLILPMHFGRSNLSYSRWGAWRRALAGLIEALARQLSWKAGFRGTALADSTPLSVCSIQRERDHKCFVREAAKAQSSLGWYYGFKLHLVTSADGALLRFWLTPATTHDVRALDQPGYLEGLEGVLVADNAYKGRARQRRLHDTGLALLARPRRREAKGLPAALVSLFQQRWRIETVIGQLKDSFGLELVRSCRSTAALRALVYSALLTLLAAGPFAIETKPSNSRIL